MVDFHSHILPGMDDGADTVKTSLAMLKTAAAQGVETQLLTPHYYPWNESPESFLSRREESAARLYAAYDLSAPELIVGAEVAFFPQLGRMELAPLCIGGSDVLLLEMPFAPWDDRVTDAIATLSLDRRCHVILAHAERFLGYRGNEEKLMHLSQLPLTVQMNAEAFLQRGIRKKAFALAAELDNLVLGSDAHDLGSRSPDLPAGRQAIEKRLGAEKLRLIDEISQAVLRRIRG